MAFGVGRKRCGAGLARWATIAFREEIIQTIGGRPQRAPRLAPSCSFSRRVAESCQTWRTSQGIPRRNCRPPWGRKRPLLNGPEAIKSPIGIRDKSARKDSRARGRIELQHHGEVRVGRSSIRAGRSGAACAGARGFCAECADPWAMRTCRTPTGPASLETISGRFTSGRRLETHTPSHWRCWTRRAEIEFAKRNGCQLPMPNAPDD